VRLVVIRRAAVALFVAAVLAGSAGAEVDPAYLPGTDAPNAESSLALPPEWTTPPAVPEVRTYDELVPIWQQAGAAYGIPWEVLAAINKVESGFGSNMGPSSAGAIGWMQFLPDTWLRWGLDASGDGIADPWNPDDAIYAAARYLAAAGGATDIYRAVYAYNHSDAYVDEVLSLAAAGNLGADGWLSSVLQAPSLGVQQLFTPDLGELIEQEQTNEKESLAKAATSRDRIDALTLRVAEAQQTAGNPLLSAAQFAALERRIVRLENVKELESRRLATHLDAARHARVRINELNQQAATLAFSTGADVGLPGVTAPGAKAALAWAVTHVGRYGYSQGPTTDRGGDVLAMQQLEPQGTTCDCSSFARWAMAQAGIDVGLTTVSQWPANGLLPDDETPQETPTVSRGVGADPPLGGYLPGDMIFWGHGGGDAGHVALYLGSGLIVQCSGDAGSNIRPLVGYGTPTGWLRWHAVTDTPPEATEEQEPQSTGEPEPQPTGEPESQPARELAALTPAPAAAPAPAPVLVPVAPTAPAASPAPPAPVFTVVDSPVVTFTR
jgi:cell wall-associated NlpC family hydrolase